jgi:hypothetical protein
MDGKRLTVTKKAELTSAEVLKGFKSLTDIEGG